MALFLSGAKGSFSPTAISSARAWPPRGLCLVWNRSDHLSPYSMIQANPMGFERSGGTRGTLGSARSQFSPGFRARLGSETFIPYGFPYTHRSADRSPATSPEDGRPWSLLLSFSGRRQRAYKNAFPDFCHGLRVSEIVGWRTRLQGSYSSRDKAEARRREFRGSNSSPTF